MPPDLSWALTAGAFRRDTATGSPARLLPELRPALQVMLAAPFETSPCVGVGRWVTHPATALWGPQITPRVGRYRGPIRTLGFALTSAGVRRLTGKAPGALLNATVELGAAGEALRQVFEAAWRNEVLNEDHVLAGMRNLLGPPPKQPQATLDLLPEPAIASQAAAAGISARHFRRCFEREWGVSPKIWQRLLRVNALAIALHPAPWDEPAHHEPALLFVDQPHMIREFKSITGFTPRAYREAMRAHPIGAIRSVPLGQGAAGEYGAGADSKKLRSERIPSRF